MDRGEFLSLLRKSLEGYIPMDEVESNLSFYRDYFEESDKSDKEIIEELGDPRLIARTIIDAYKASKGPMADFYTEQARNEFRKEHSERYDEESIQQNSKRHFGSSFKWYEKLAFWLIVAVVIIVAIAVIGFVIIYILPAILLIIIIKILVDYFSKNN